MYIELYSNKMTLRQLAIEDFTSSRLNLSQQDNSTKKIIDLIAKQARPLLSDAYSVDSVLAKDFLFGRLYSVEIADQEIDY